MATVTRKVDKITGEKEDIESMLKRFKKKVLAEGTLAELEKRRFYVKPSKKKRLKREAAARARKKNTKSKENLYKY